jgi:hypothetical protein
MIMTFMTVLEAVCELLDNCNLRSPRRPEYDIGHGLSRSRDFFRTNVAIRLSICIDPVSSPLPFRLDIRRGVSHDISCQSASTPTLRADGDWLPYLLYLIYREERTGGSGKIARFLGTKDGEGLVRGYGLREIASGVGIFAKRKPTSAVWSRIVGEAIDLASLGSALNDSSRPRNVGIAIAMVAGVTALDLLCGRKLSHDLAKAPARYHPRPGSIGRPGSAGVTSMTTP